MLEKGIENRLKLGAKKRQGVALKFWCIAFTGLPDRIVLVPRGKFYFVELKKVGGVLSDRQKIVFPWLEKMGFPVTVIWTVEGVDDFYKTIDLC